MWDAEASMANCQELPTAEVRIHASQPGTLPSLNAGPARFHHRLFAFPAYQLAFQARAARHFGAGGILGPVTATENPGGALWQEMADDFDAFANGESARWGDAAEDGGGPSRRYSAWVQNTSFNRDTWIPQRRIHFVQKLAEFDLADPQSHPDIFP